MNTKQRQKDKVCHYLHFGLIVTGKSERAHLAKLFSPLLKTGLCDFKIIRQVGQRDPISSNKRWRPAIRVATIARSTTMPGDSSCAEYCGVGFQRGRSGTRAQ